MPAVSGSQRIKGQIEGAADSVTVVAQPLFDPQNIMASSRTRLWCGPIEKEGHRKAFGSRITARSGGIMLPVLSLAKQDRAVTPPFQASYRP
jgi:hypothetical protein